jgi:hypothetical protein
MDIRFQIHMPGEKILNYPAQFKVKDVSMCGVLIQTDVNLVLQSIIPRELVLHEDNFLHFNGRVASTRIYEEQGDARCDIGVEFTDLSEEGAGLLKSFIDYLAMSEMKASADEVDA